MQRSQHLKQCAFSEATHVNYTRCQNRVISGSTRKGFRDLDYPVHRFQFSLHHQRNWLRERASMDAKVSPTSRVIE
jgi:hypothetical protein